MPGRHAWRPSLILVKVDCHPRVLKWVGERDTIPATGAGRAVRPSAADPTD